MHLRELTADFEMYLNADTDEEIAAALAEITAGQIEDKAENYCYFLRDLEGDIEKFKTEGKRIASVIKVMENKHAHVKDYMKTTLELAGINNLPAGIFKVSVQQNPPALSVVDDTLCPAEYIIEIPATTAKDTPRIKDDLKAGKDVPGYELTRGTSLRIR